MHDITDFERRGLPGVMVASNQFIDAAEAQSKRLGFSPERVFVNHPIQDRTDDEIKALADQAVDELVRLLTAS